MDAATPGDAVARPSSANPEMSGNDPNRGEADLSSIESDRVDDPKGLLDQDDHMRDMERVEMDVVCVKKPMATIRRVTGRIAPANPVAWTSPNVAIRMELEQPRGGRATTRVYTVRRFQLERGLVEIDFVLHEDDSPAMRWLRAAEPGTCIWITGPRQHFVPQPVAGRRVAMLADDTAIPAIFAILNAWPPGQQGTLWLDTCEAGALDDLPAPPGVTRHLLLRPSGQAPGTARSLLAAAGEALADPDAWTVWAAGERQEMRELRAILGQRGFARDVQQILGYWRLGLSSSELDRQRLQEYERLRARNLPMDELDDADLPI